MYTKVALSKVYLVPERITEVVKPYGGPAPCSERCDKIASQCLSRAHTFKRDG